MCENTVLRRTFGPKAAEETGGWRGLHNWELHNVYSSPNLITMIESRKIRWVRHGTRIERRGILVGF
jgi:hypothetical protein